jgi:hypothetical protein
MNATRHPSVRTHAPRLGSVGDVLEVLRKWCSSSSRST